MHCVHAGRGDAILFIHGMPTNHALWAAVTREMSSRYRCFAVDLPGLGNSPSIPYGPEYLDHLTRHLEILRKRHLVKRWHIVGHDAGAAIAVHYAGCHPQRVAKLVLLSPAIFPDLQPYYLMRLLRKPIVGELLAPVVKLAFWHIAMRRALSYDATQATWKSFYQRFSGKSGAWQLMRLVRWGTPAEMLGALPETLPQLRMPALVFHGTRDVLPPRFAERAASLLPSSQLIKIDGGHFLPVEKPRELAAELHAFFRPASAVRAAALG